MRSDQPMAELKAQIQELHTHIETHPFVTALIAHRLPLECYVRQLRALAVIHSVLERELAACEDARVAVVWHEGLRKLDWLLADIGYFDSAAILDSVPVIEAALAIAEQIRLRAVEQPVTLLGYLYVLEGTTLGNCLHGRDLVAMYQLVGEAGHRYYASYPGQARGHWNAFTERMNGALSGSEDLAASVAAAREAFTGLERLYLALYPIDSQEKIYHVTRLNPEAGNQPMPQDPAEIAAARRASERVWLAFGYFEARYGERGRRFSDSDACWLAALADLEREEVLEQIAWLGHLLAVRGVPRITLERTLDSLHEELVTARPERSSAFDGLAIGAAQLRAQRLAVIPEEAVEELVAEFERRVGPSLAGQYPGTAELLIGAVADEYNGTTAAVAAIQSWLSDPQHFTEGWIAAVEATLMAAQSRVTKRLKR